MALYSLLLYYLDLLDLLVLDTGNQTSNKNKGSTNWAKRILLEYPTQFPFPN